jgi:hypothetical protein
MKSTLILTFENGILIDNKIIADNNKDESLMITIYGKLKSCLFHGCKCNQEAAA